MDLALLGTQPIGPDRPAGEDVRYDSRFEELQGEIDKLVSPTASGGVDWEKVVGTAGAILAEKSKDLLVAAYLAVGLIHRRKVEGLETGLKVLLDLLANFWETLYPAKARMRGRVAAITWWVEKAEAAVRAFPSTEVPAARLETILSFLDGIDRFLGDNMEDAPPLRPLRDAIEEVLVAREEPPPPAPQVAQEPAPPPAAPPAPSPAGEPPAAPREIASEADAEAAIEGAAELALRAADYLRAARLSDPLPFRLTRFAAWVRVGALPPESGGRTEVPSPPDFLREPILAARAGGGEDFVRAVEEAVPRAVFWLDLHRMAAEALCALGGEYAAAREAVCAETAAFARRLAGVEALAFSDGTPFADDETRRWLAGLAGGEGAAKAARGAQEEAAAAALRGRPLVEEGRIGAAVAPLERGIRTAPSERDRMIWRLALVRLLVETGNGVLALSHLERVLRDIEAFRLEEYDPAIALEGLRLAFLEIQGRADRPEDGADREILKRIARLDLAEAVRIQQG